MIVLTLFLFINYLFINKYIFSQLSEDMLLMVNKLGQEYACSLPQLPDNMSQGRKDDQVAQEENIDISGIIYRKS